VRSSLENLLQRSNFEDLCEKWRSFERKEGVWVMFLMEEYGKNLMVKNKIFSQKREILV
jgi:hypothetical protein